MRFLQKKVLHILFHGCVLVRENQEFKTLKCVFLKCYIFLFHGCILVRENQEFKTLKCVFFSISKNQKNSVENVDFLVHKMKL